MARFYSLCFALAIAGWLAPQSLSADDTKNGIIVSATGGTSSIKLTGTYTVAANYEVSGITLKARPAGGKAGEGGEEKVKGEKGSFKGVISVPAGTYDVYALLRVTDDCGNESYYFSAVSSNITVRKGK